MVNPRSQFQSQPRLMEGDAPADGARFTVLLTEDREHAIEHWTHQLPRLLEPQGVQALVARTGREALSIARQRTIHAAVVDLLTPADQTQGRPTTSGAAGPAAPGGIWLLEILRRRPVRLPVVLVSNPNYSQRMTQRYLNEALRLGAFSVLNRPVELEALLQAIRRLIDRQYKGAWPPRGDASLTDPQTHRPRGGAGTSTTWDDTNDRGATPPDPARK